MKLYVRTFAILIHKNNVYMKQFFAFALLAFIASASISDARIKSECFSCSEDKEQIVIVSNIFRINANESERSLDDWPYVEAWLCAGSGTVEVIVSGIGTAAIGIVDSRNRVIDHDVVDTGCVSVVSLDVSGLAGTYRLVISSDSCYAEGSFTL
jgi:hypothetical protein